MEIVKDSGVLASIAWNSNGWTDDPSAEDLKQAAYAYVRDNGRAAESITFGNELYPAEKDDTYLGYTPSLNRSLKSKNIEAVFLFSCDYKNKNRKTIVGIYAFPEIGWAERKTKHKILRKYNGGNIRSSVEDIVYFQNPIIIDNQLVAKDKLLPYKKQISTQGFNYLNSDNVANILRLAVQLNPADNKLQRLVKKFPMVLEITDESVDDAEFDEVIQSQDAETSIGIAQLEKKMQQLRPQLKERISAFIERGTIATKVKSLTGYKCLVCEAMGINPIGFMKPDGLPYVETHHVDPVSHLAVGALGLANLITLCANHHRQMHYGDARLVKQTKTSFTFAIDGHEFYIPKVKI